ncbi:acetate and sugar kinases/Hsc70/actin family protein [Portibacter lacus]|uniref:Ppx/GppA phosphatase domain-containing protein n=1 Tax=Portibacter lacus TaxID=1099794 RepID=A0AA37WFY5_9BACT|nr:hypothetical protein [Portibacter lacus]GLR17430.1 hypothetical protein GCM10007940_20450 [Portibacter lacus]
MNKLTTFSKLLITLVILALLFFGYKYLAPSLGLPELGTGNNTTNEVVIGEDENGEAIKTEMPPKTAKTKNNNSSTWNYTAVEPIGGKLKGVVELGASGFNSFIIKTDSDKNWKLEKAEWSNSLVYEGMASGTDVTQGLKQYIAKFLDYGVSGNEIHFVVSSGALKNDKTQPIIKALKDLGFVVNEVTPEQEGSYALKSVLPKSYENSAFVVDIGSGNTKISWIEGGKVKAVETYGAKYFQNSIADSKAYADAKKYGEMIPSSKTNTCFIIGGVPFTLAKEGRDGKERYTVLNKPGSYDSDEAKTKAGLNIYQGLVDGTGCDQFVFDWDANFTIGFLLTLPY